MLPYVIKTTSNAMYVAIEYFLPCCLPLIEAHFGELEIWC